MAVFLRERAFDPWQEIQLHLATNPSLRLQAGANALFVGTMRELNQGHAVTAMTLEHYPAMTARYLADACARAAAAHDILDALVVHRVGTVVPSDTLVLVAVWAVHRAPAFSACRALMEDLKRRAPFWKREETPGGPRWVAAEGETGGKAGGESGDEGLS